MATTVLEHCRVAPSPAAVPEFSLPLTFFDMMWYRVPPNQNVLFFDPPVEVCSKSHFLNDVVPKLKSSLVATLTHFLPLAGSIVHPLKPAGNKDKPTIRYKSGDSVSFTVAESSANFHQLTGNHPRDSDEFYPLAPNLPPQSWTEHSIACPVLALQVTIFPDYGYSVGITSHHVVVDACTLVSFVKSWALINNSNMSSSKGSEDVLKEHNLWPFYDRKQLIGLNGLDTLYWDQIIEHGGSPPEHSARILPTGRVRATYVLGRDEIHRLKSFVPRNSGGSVVHLSTFTVVIALFWHCMAASTGDAVAHDDEPDGIMFAADCRGRLNPPLPETYFGNCIGAVYADELTHREVKAAEDGFFKATKAIGDAIKGMLSSEEEILRVTKKLPELKAKWVGYRRKFGVAGSTRFDICAVDYGWGKAKKFEALFIDTDWSISLCKSRDLDGLEVGISRTTRELSAFDGAFKELLANICMDGNCNKLKSFVSKM